MGFHKTKRWISKREKILRRDEYRCRECKRYGRSTEAAMVHHIYPVEERPNLGLNNNNLISLCNKCHNKMHDRKTNKLTKEGFKWVERIKDIIPPT